MASVTAALVLAALLAAPGEGKGMNLISSAFQPGGSIPSRFTCDGGNVSPPLAWSGVPGPAKSLALVVTDPDAPDPKAPKMTWVHWILYDLPAESKGLREAVPPKGLPAGAFEGSNDWGKTGYGGPCPPIGRHRYVFTLYALDAGLPDLRGPSRAALEKAMDGHVLQKAELIGTYQRQ
jgi:Raf kinase inhibitor-like YbhB/YbcL family protein